MIINWIYFSENVKVAVPSDHVHEEEDITTEMVGCTSEELKEAVNNGKLLLLHNSGDIVIGKPDDF